MDGTEQRGSRQRKVPRYDKREARTPFIHNNVGRWGARWIRSGPRTRLFCGEVTCDTRTLLAHGSFKLFSYAFFRKWDLIVLKAGVSGAVEIMGYSFSAPSDIHLSARVSPEIHPSVDHTSHQCKIKRRNASL